ncbi:whirlin isoform X2 [Procambarus clarkii]
MIRGGVEYGLGIFITGVDEDSAAHKAGLQVGDQILEVNAESFLAVTHDTAVNILKYSRRLRLTVRRVGKVPHSCTTYDRRCWPPAHTNGETSAENMEATLTMIEEKSQRVLTRTHHARLREVVSDYAAGRIPIDHLLVTTRDLLNSPDKMSLLTELREVVRPEDQEKFDAAVFRTAAVRVQEKPLRRHSHTGDPNGCAPVSGKPQTKSLHILAHHPQRPALGHARKQYDDFDSPANRSRGDGFELLPSTRVRDDYDPASSGLIEDYDPPPSRLRDGYDSPPSRVRDGYDSSPSRVKEEYDISTRVRDEYESSTRVRDEYESSTRTRDEYESSPRVRDEYESSSRVRDEYDSSVSRGRKEYDPPSSSRVRDDYDPPPSRVRDDYDYDPIRPGRHRDEFESREEYGKQGSRGRENFNLDPDEYDIGGRVSSREDYNATPHFREVFETPPARLHYTPTPRQVCFNSAATAPSSPSGRRSASEEREETHPPYKCGSRRTSLVVSDSLGRFRVVVKKTRPNLGIAIEGGADTKQKLPRVINIAANGAAFEAGGLRVGQVILAVDGQKLDGQSHEEAARLIAGCWVSRSRPEVEFMVVERKATAADVRRSSISLLSQM